MTQNSNDLFSDVAWQGKIFARCCPHRRMSYDAGFGTIYRPARVAKKRSIRAQGRAWQ